MYDHYQNDFAEFWFDDGILFCKYKPYTILILSAAKQVVTDRLKLQGEISFPVLCDIRAIDNAEKSARDFMSFEGTTLCSAVAFLAEPDYTKELFNFYVALNKPAIPVRLFTQEQEAINYLKTFKKWFERVL